MPYCPFFDCKGIGALAGLGFCQVFRPVYPSQTKPPLKQLLPEGKCQRRYHIYDFGKAGAAGIQIR